LLPALGGVGRDVGHLLIVCGRVSSTLFLVEVETAMTPVRGGVEARRGGGGGRGRRGAGWSPGTVGRLTADEA